MQTQTAIENDEISMEELDLLFADMDGDTIEEAEEDLLDMSAAEIASTDEVGDEEVELSVLTKALKAINSKELAGEIYAEQESSDDHVEKSEAVEKVVKIKKEAKAKTTTPRKTTHTHSVNELIAERASENFYLLEKSDLELDEKGKAAKLDDTLAMINAMNVKGVKKCMNFMFAVNGKVKMSTFINSGVKYILGDNAMTKSDLEAFLMSSTRNKVKAYNKSTAAPQALNLLKMFTDLKVLKKVGGVYELNENSLYLETLWRKINDE